MDEKRKADIVAYAKEHCEVEGELEIDVDAKVSEGHENGAYVQCWKWIDFHETSFDKGE